MFQNNLENTHRACAPPIRWHQHPAGTFVTFPMALPREEPALLGKEKWHLANPLVFLEGVSKGAQGRYGCSNLLRFPKGI